MKPQLNVASDIAGIKPMSLACLSAGDKTQSDITTPSHLSNIVINVFNIISGGFQLSETIVVEIVSVFWKKTLFMSY